MSAFEDIKQTIFEFGAKKDKARDGQDFEIYQAAIDALLRVNWSAFCRGGGIFSIEMKNKTKEAA